VIAYETFFVTLRARSLDILEKQLSELVTRLVDEFEDEEVISELRNLELEIRARLQRIAAGDLQT
jgi:hypothetical protein